MSSSESFLFDFLAQSALSEIIERAAPILGVSFLFPFFPREEAHIS
jgi:hypothetical protein